MARTLQQYADWLDSRDLLWPKPPAPRPVKAKPTLKPLRGIRAVTWSVYGTLLRITDGRLLFDPPQQLRIQIALEKTIEEFNMWNSMYRTPGAPWEGMYRQYRKLLDDREMAGTAARGEFPEIRSAEVWQAIITRLQEKEYTWDEGEYGDTVEYAEKIAWYFHSMLQGVEPAAEALQTLTAIADAGLTQTLLADGQSFTMLHLLRALQAQGTLPPPGNLFATGCLTLSASEGVRKPSPSLYTNCLERLSREGIAPEEVLHVGTRLSDDLAVARRCGMRTVLVASDKLSLAARPAELKDRDLRPDRLITQLSQLRDILGIA